MAKCEFPAFGYCGVETRRTSKNNFQSEDNKRREDENNKEERPFSARMFFRRRFSIYLAAGSLGAFFHSSRRPHVVLFCPCMSDL